MFVEHSNNLSFSDINLGLISSQSHNVECYAYGLIGRFEESHAVPRIFYTKTFDEEVTSDSFIKLKPKIFQNALAGQICMEYAEGAKMMDPCKAATIEQMKQV